MAFNYCLASRSAAALALPKRARIIFSERDKHIWSDLVCRRCVQFALMQDRCLVCVLSDPDDIPVANLDLRNEHGRARTCLLPRLLALLALMTPQLCIWCYACVRTACD